MCSSTAACPAPSARTSIEQFRNDDDCRLFFSTDAGGVGLNLQFASVVVNVDLPWNPAVLEQRIGRVHRLGQKQPVRVVNFVAKGTIEEGMLSVLKFKKSLFAGVLDGGESKVLLGGTKMTKFMETVEATTGQIPAAIATEAEEASEAKRELASPKVDKKGESSALALPTADPWSGLLQAGMALAQQLSRASREAPSKDGYVRRDEATGETYLRFPVPSPEVVNQALRNGRHAAAGVQGGSEVANSSATRLRLVDANRLAPNSCERGSRRRRCPDATVRRLPALLVTCQ